MAISTRPQLIFLPTAWDDTFAPSSQWNLAPNPVFDDWTGSVPDDWTQYGGGMTVARQATTKIGLSAVDITRSGTDCYIYCDISNPTAYAGLGITVGVWVKTSTATQAYVSIGDDGGGHNSSYHTGGGSWEYLEVEHTVTASPAYLRIALRVYNTNGTASFSGACATCDSDWSHKDGKSYAQLSNGANLLTNGGMETWTSGASSAPDDWSLAGAGATIAQTTDPIKGGSYCAAVARNGADATLSQATGLHATYQGMTVTAGCWVYASTASQARIGITDGVAPVNSSYHTGGGSWEWLEVSILMDGAASALTVTAEVVTSDGTAYFDACTLEAGGAVMRTDIDSSVTTAVEIQDAGTDLHYYTKSLPSHASTDVIWAEAKCWMHEAAETGRLDIYSDTLGTSLTITMRGSDTGTIVFGGNSDNIVTLDMSGNFRKIKVMLSSSGYRVLYASDVNTTYTMIASGTPATYAGGSDKIEFGKIDATDDDSPQCWAYVRYAVGDSYVFPYAPNGWQVNDRDTKKAVNVAYDGTIEAIHERDDQDITFRSIAHTDANCATITALYETYLAPGTAFYLTEDHTNYATSWYVVKMLDKRWRWQRSASVPTRWDKSWKLRVVDE